MLLLRALLAGAFVCAIGSAFQEGSATVPVSGIVRSTTGTPAAAAAIEFVRSGQRYAATATDQGRFAVANVSPGSYTIAIEYQGGTYRSKAPVAVRAATSIKLQLAASDIVEVEPEAEAEASGGESLSSKEVTAIPLNKRDFSQLLLLAAGTMTDTNGATNFTQQFAINGQRGVEAVFAMDGSDTSDPEMGGATLSNFNVDAVQEIQSSSGWMPADVGRGAAGYTNIVTRGGTNVFHGSVFEFLRNSALDARNFFDERTPVNPQRIPPFRRNEFGFTIGGPVILPGYDGRAKTEFFAEYQGFRQVLGTTQVLAVPSAAERSGIDTTAYPGDTLYVPVNATVAGILARYPLPNDPAGPFGGRTFATSSRVATNADQFSVRVDHQISQKDHLFGRFTMDNLTGPTTNPDQTALNPAFGITYIDRQRNAAITWTRVLSPSATMDSSLSFTRTTPNFPTPDHTDPSIIFGDGLYEPFNAPGGSVTASYGNLFEGRQNFVWTRGGHTVKAGAEFRANRDTTYFGTAPNGQYTFGGGAAFATAPILSASGLHNVSPGQQLPDTLSALLQGSAFSYTVAVAPPQFPQGDQIGVAAISRYGTFLYVEDTWKVSSRLVIDYGLRFELYSPITERAHRTAGIQFVNGPNGPEQLYLVNPQPTYGWWGNNFGPRLRVNWQAAHDLWLRAGGGITTIPPNIWQDNMLTGAAPYVDYPRITAAPGAPLPIETRILPSELPPAYTPSGTNILASGNSKDVPPNTVWDVDRFEQELAAITPSHLVSPLNANAVSRNFHNAYLATWSFAAERTIGSMSSSLGYIGTAGVDLPAIDFPNAFPGAAPLFARYTEFNPAGQIVGGFGTDMLITNRSHSSYHALQASVQGNLGRAGPQVQANFTWSKSLDDTSSVIGPGVGSTSGAAAPPWPQNPFDTRAEKGPSTFDVGEVFTATVMQDLHADRAPFVKRLGPKLTRGWQLLSISTLMTGLPFTVYSGVQQTGVGSMGTDRPDQVGTPQLSTGRKIREDYFGLGTANASYFFIPIGVPAGTGPNQGVFGSLGRNTFRGPGFHNFDFALIKDTEWESAANRLINMQFRAEFFNLFNIVNFGLPSNVLTGSGFGLINRTAGTSRQIQFSLKLMF